MATWFLILIQFGGGVVSVPFQSEADCRNAARIIEADWYAKGPKLRGISTSCVPAKKEQ